MLYSITILTRFIFLQISHPLAIGLILLLQTILICLITGIMAKSFWFSYILFLIFLGGILVLFIYVTSLASNEIFSISSLLILLSTRAITLTAIVAWFTDKPIISIILNDEIKRTTSITIILPENSLNLNKLYNYPTNIITIILIIYLLISLVATVKITNVFYGPLRPMN